MSLLEKDKWRYKFQISNFFTHQVEIQIMLMFGLEHKNIEKDNIIYMSPVNHIL